MDIPTKEQLSALLERVSVEEAARAANVSKKTIYRYRWGKTFPTLDVLILLSPLLKQAKRSAKNNAKQPA